MKEYVQIVRGADLDQALSKQYRQYLTGHLQKPQVHLQHIEDDIEVGVSYYRNFTADTPHLHPVATEHGYVLQGSIRVLILEEEPKEYQFDAGDFFVIRPGIGYATKNAPETKILFIKSPGINDKTIIPITDAVAQWLAHWDN